MATLPLAACRPADRPGTPPRDFLLLTVDTLRADHLSSWLYPRPTGRSLEPEAQREAGSVFDLDRLASDGVMFRRAFAHRGQTFPSTASLMTGRHPFAHGAIDNVDRLPNSVPTLAEVFASEGFRTGAFTTNRLLGPGVGPNGQRGEPSGIERGFRLFAQEFAQPDRDYLMIKRAIEWVQEQRADGDPPLFTWVHLMGPHLPYDPAPFQGRDFAELYVDPDYRGEADGSREFLDTAYAEGRPLSGEDIYRVVALYDAEIARVARLLELFFLVYDDLGDGERGGLARTLTVFAADHGEELYQRNGYWAHSKSVYSSVLHVPLVFHHPPSLTGRRVLDDLVQLDDVLPTVCDWFGFDTPDGVTGRSLLAAMDEWMERPFVNRPAFGYWRDQIFTVRDDRFRLVWNPTGVEPDDPPEGAYPVPELALFDLERDPLELRDVAADFPDEAERLQLDLEDWIADLEFPADARTVADPARIEALIELGYLDPGARESKEPGE